MSCWKGLSEYARTHPTTIHAPRCLSSRAQLCTATQPMPSSSHGQISWPSPKIFRASASAYLIRLSPASPSSISLYPRGGLEDHRSAPALTLIDTASESTQASRSYTHRPRVPRLDGIIERCSPGVFHSNTPKRSTSWLPRIWTCTKDAGCLRRTAATMHHYDIAQRALIVSPTCTS